jgi:hypothetical protein
MPAAAAGISAGTSLLGGILGSGAAGAASRAMQRAGGNAVNEVNADKSAALGTAQSVWGQERANLNPYLETGAAALSQLGGSVLSGTPNAGQVLAEDPGYQFRLDQGQLALQRAEAAGGGVGSGGAMKAAEQYGQDYASGEYGNAFNRFMQSNQQRYGQLMGLAGIGQSANQMFDQAGQSYAGLNANVNMDAANLNANLITGIGNAQAAGAVGSANAWNGALSGMGNAATGYASLSALGRQPAAAPDYNSAAISNYLGPSTALSPYTLGDLSNPQIAGNGSGYDLSSMFDSNQNYIGS